MNKKKSAKSSDSEQDNKPLEKRNYPKWFYLVLVLMPVILLSLIEIFLRIINYGDSYQEFVTLTKKYPDELILNPEITSKYFNNLKNYPTPTPDAFLKVKKENSFRIFVIGGSSAQGWPYVPTASFPSSLKRRLKLLFPDKYIEVINCGISAINTYTIRDLLPEILEQSPDLILIYAGHNEYYGALGPGSSVSLGRSRFLINAYISLEKFRTTQLLRSGIGKIWNLFSSDNQPQNNNNETLMGQVIGESTIPLNSSTYLAGISQFRENMDDIIKMCSDKNVPVIMGTLTSNVKDLKPFISVKENNLPQADSVYNEAKLLLKNGNTNEARKLFKRAKDLDALRFRAPGDINLIIRQLGEKYKCHILDVDSVFESYSPDNIVGNNLTVDHLHPNLEGYKLMAKAFFQEMQKLNLLPGNNITLPISRQDSILDADFPYTRLDSTVAKIKIAVLTGTYPFKPKGASNEKLDTLKLNSYVDTLAFNYANKSIGWVKAHLEAAEWYFSQKEYDAFIKEINPLIDQFPFDAAPYEYLAKNLIDAKQYSLVLPFLYDYYKIDRSYYPARWIGTINLNNMKIKEALKYLEPASRYSEADNILFYNLAGAYYYNKEYKKSLDAINKSIQLNPNNNSAKEFRLQLNNFLKANNIKL